MTWHRVAAGGAGTVAGLATLGDRVLAATAAGLSVSSDAGLRWTPAGQGLAFAEAVAATDDVILVCAAGGLYGSNDGGARWRRVLEGSHMMTVATAGSVAVAGSEADGVLRSDDGGQSWTGANAGLVDLTVLCLVLSPCFERDGAAFLGTPSGVYRSRNGARAWRAVETGLQDPAVQCLAISPDFMDDRLVVAGTEADGLLVSRDGGTSWQPVLSGSVSAVAFGPRGTLVAATDAGVFVSTDAGQTWQRRGPLPGAVLSLQFAGEVLLAGLQRQGVARSSDLGQTWQAASSGPDADVPIALAATRQGGVIVATLELGVRWSTDAGSTWHDANTGLDGATVLGLASDDERAFAATSTGLFARDGDAWRPVDVPLPARAIAAAGGQVAWVTGDNTVRLSAEGGREWVTRPLAVEGDVVSLAVAADASLYVGVRRRSGEFVLWRNDQRWLVEPNVAARVMPIAIDADGSVFVALGAHVLTPLRSAQERRGAERRPLWRRTMVARDVVAISALATSRGALVAATNAGPFISHDRAQTFTNWSDGLGRPAIVALAVVPDGHIYALTLGGGIWTRAIAS